MTEELKPLSEKHRQVQDEYLACWNKTESYKKVYLSASHSSAKTAAARLFADDNFQAHLQARLADLHMSVEEALARETEIGRVGVGFFFKMSDEWMFNPLPEYEILEEVEIVDDTKDPPEKRISYRVRHAVLDMDKVIDPRYSHLIKKFSNSRKNGVSIELYDGQAVHNNVLKMAGKFTQRVDFSNSDGSLKPEVKVTDVEYARTITSLADTLRDILSGAGGKQDSDMDAKK